MKALMQDFVCILELTWITLTGFLPHKRWNLQGFLDHVPLRGAGSMFPFGSAYASRSPSGALLLFFGGRFPY